MSAPADWSDLAALLAPALAQAAGPDGRPASVSLDLGEPADGAALEVVARIERATRTLIFLSAEARTPEGRLAVAATAVFRRGG